MFNYFEAYKFNYIIIAYFKISNNMSKVANKKKDDDVEDEVAVHHVSNEMTEQTRPADEEHAFDIK